MSVKIKSYAKINLTLNVGKPADGFHPIDSIVTTVDICDEIILSKRKDDAIRLTMRDLGEYDIKTEENNAYKAAKLFCEEFKTKGANIEIRKRIAIGGGLGGSSADVAGVLRGMKKLYDIDCDVKPLADKLGSDCGYMLVGGTARISGRGEEVKQFKRDLGGYVVIVYCENGVSTKACYALFDELTGEYFNADNDETELAIESEDFNTLAKNISNGLALPAEKLCDEIRKNLNAIKDLSPAAYSVTGSGSCVFALYETKELCLWAADKLKKADIDCEVVSFIPRYEK